MIRCTFTSDNNRAQSADNVRERGLSLQMKRVMEGRKERYREIGGYGGKEGKGEEGGKPKGKTK